MVCEAMALPNEDAYAVARVWVEVSYAILFMSFLAFVFGICSQRSANKHVIKSF